MLETIAEQFPRSTTLPTQTPLHWVKQKDRYLRQVLIRDIEAVTKRPLVVYYSDTSVPGCIIDHSDEKHIHELLVGIQGDFDLMLETNGGLTDAAEAILTLLSKAAGDYRVIVPLRAKSSGTTIALGARMIVMGMASELGPIEPHYNGLPASILITTAAASMVEIAKKGMEQTNKIAKAALRRGMLPDATDEEIEEVVDKLATTNRFPVHGAVVDSVEAANIGLNVTVLAPNDDLWRQIWLLRCMYEFDARATGCMKIFESANASQSIRLLPPQA